VARYDVPGIVFESSLENTWKECKVTFLLPLNLIY